MKPRHIILIGFGCLILLGVYPLVGKSPSLPVSAKTITISQSEPYSSDLIVEKTIADQKIIEELLTVLSGAKSCSEHKCSSIGDIAFLSKENVRVLEVLPGHDPSKYEFRFEGGIYKLSRDAYIDALVAAGIDHVDIHLDGHPEIESR